MGESALQRLIAKKQESIAANKQRGIDTIKPAMGKHVYRILPSWRQDGGEVEWSDEEKAQFWHDYSQHWIKPKVGAKAEAVYLCVQKTFGKQCDVCAGVQGAMLETDDDEFRNHIKKECTSKQKYLLNVLHLTGEKDKRAVPQVLEIGPKIFEEIVGLIPDWGDITDLADGTDLVIEKSGAGLDTKYTVNPRKKSVKIPKKVMEKINDLDAAVKQENTVNKEKALTLLARMAGLELASGSTAVGALAAPGAPETSFAAMADEIEDAEGLDLLTIDEADVTTVDEPAPLETDAVQEDDDDIDALLAALDA